MRVWLIVGMLAGATVALAQDEPNDPAQQSESPADQMGKLQQKAFRLIGAMQSLGDWDEHYEYVTDATNRIFERNHWDSESDLFALEMVREVGKIPPWATQERFDAALEMVGDRYLLDEGQIATLQSQAIKMNIDLFSKHADRILGYAVEAIETRAAGEPFTPEQVARWVTLAEPVMLDARASVNKFAEDFMEELDPEQRELVQMDLKAANRRMSDMERMTGKWKRGEWDPSDWGMEADPIQNPDLADGTPAAETETKPSAENPAEPGGVRKPEAPAGPATEAEQAPPKSAAEPEANDPWAQYVRAFIRKYQLDDEQQQRAWIFYRHTKERDEVFARRHDRNVGSLRGKSDDDASERARAAMSKENERRVRETDRLFGQLKQRLERLPTRLQRKNAEPGEIELSGKPAGKVKAEEAP